MTTSTDANGRAAWLDARRQGVGSSDIPRIAGLSRWGGALEVYYEKTEGLDRPAGESAEIGLAMEPALAAIAARKLGRRLVKVPTIHRPGVPHHMASIDRVTVIGRRPATSWANFDGIVELKTALGYAALDWSDDRVPDDYLAQVQWQMYVSGLGKAWVAALLGIPVEVKLFEITPDPDFQADLVKIADEFHARVIERRPPPADGLDSTTMLLRERWKPDPDSTVVLDPAEFIPARDLYRRACDSLAGALADKAVGANCVRQMLGSAEAGVHDGKVAVTWKADERGQRRLHIPKNPKPYGGAA